MLLDPKKRELRCDDGTLIKQLNCPNQVDWSKMETTSDRLGRQCYKCNMPVLDTALYSENDLLAKVRADNSTCLKVNPEQDNVLVVFDEN